MNTYYINDETFINSEIYQNFIRNNPSEGYLKIRASAASSAIPIEGLKVIVSKEIEGNNVIFFQGNTDSSGVIDRILLPAPKLDLNNMVKPSNTIYNVSATYLPDNTTENYQSRIYEGVCTILDINIIPKMKVGYFNEY